MVCLKFDCRNKSMPSLFYTDFDAVQWWTTIWDRYMGLSLRRCVPQWCRCLDLGVKCWKFNTPCEAWVMLNVVILHSIFLKIIMEDDWKWWNPVDDDTVALGIWSRLQHIITWSRQLRHRTKSSCDHMSVGQQHSTTTILHQWWYSSKLRIVRATIIDITHSPLGAIIFPTSYHRIQTPIRDAHCVCVMKCLMNNNASRQPFIINDDIRRNHWCS